MIKKEITKVSTGTTGTVGELIVAADLLKRGFSVYKSLSPNAPCDLIAIKKGKIIKVEVTNGYKRKDGRIMHGKKDHHYSFDILAIVIDKNDISYSPDIVVYDLLEWQSDG